ncbi:protein retinal degeneration B-like isoform X1 [Mytilus californianus]|uniref:protein retinal degeneration B-like isoform X1 n=2 Tax=Mytilus californianus TaxID=6549 RepID=UPI0022459809|nr:protein retinal degeneration B-like isoform X1 [Mytilus californianus]XP_052074555.1 protein retinal degeneration B-like isoform X1 [Mytilus californianus]
MLVKEYRIALPMSVEEYRIAQLYMIQKKSRDESSGEGSGVEIIVNEPYTDGPGGNGQYTYKIYHIGSHLPGWFRAILPKSALRVEEEAWNSYPYTKTRYRCPFVEKFLLEIETKYLNDGGTQENVFKLSQSEIKQRQIDYLDIVKDPISSGDYRKEEDPKLYKSTKTQRGPLTDTWWKEHSEGLKSQSSGKAIMTAYKLCRVEFKYWGMQNKIERFIHEIGLRKTMLRAHRQAWCWQDEWYGLQISDIRRLELETQRALAEKMGVTSENEEEEDDQGNTLKHNSTSAYDERPKIPISKSEDTVSTSSDSKLTVRSGDSPAVMKEHRSLSASSKSRSFGSSVREISTTRMFESLEKLQESSSDEEFFDAEEEFIEFYLSNSTEDLYERSADPQLLRSSPIDVQSLNDEFADARSTISLDPADTPLERRMEQIRQHYSIDLSTHPHTSPPDSASCKSSILFMVLHGGCLVDTHVENQHPSKRNDFVTMKSSFESVIRSHYPGAYGHIAFRLVPCPQICSDVLDILASITPFSFESQTPNSVDGPLWTQEFVPLGAIALFASSNPDYHECVNKTVSKANIVYQEFLMSDEGKGFNGQVSLIADSTSSVLAYDALCQNPSCMRYLSTYDSREALPEVDSTVSFRRERSKTESSGAKTNIDTTRQLSHSDPDLTLNSPNVNNQCSKSDIVSIDYKMKRTSSTRDPPSHPSHQSYLNVNEKDPSRRTSTGSNFEGTYLKFDFDVSDMFILGSPLGLVLAYRRMYCCEDRSFSPYSPACGQVYNIFHNSDPSAFRLEPLLNNTFRYIPPVKVSRYSKYPLGDGEPVHVVETVQSNLSLFLGTRKSSSGHILQRQNSISSVASNMSGMGENTVSVLANVTSKWWGNKRIDFELYSPDILHSFPTSALPPLFHASFWESSDLASFILRQVLRHDVLLNEAAEKLSLLPDSVMSAKQPKEKWLKRRTTIKVKNLQANHRGNDVIVVDGKEQTITARFMYGSFDVTSLSGEKVDVHVNNQSTGDWEYLGTSVTDKHGRLQFTVPKEKMLPQGMHPVKVVVRGDHTFADFFLSVLPPNTDTVVFSIDGSFTASVSISGKDPKVRGGAVDVVRHWQDQGYLIIYVTARPDMQHRKVVSWLAMHNFPHGMVAFMEGITKDPLRQKLNYLKGLQTDAQIVYRAAYGSSKDIYVYKELGLTVAQIFIVGKASKKDAAKAQVLADGYGAHLNDLLAAGSLRPVLTNARIIRRGCIAHPEKSEGKKQLKRSSSHNPAGKDAKQLENCASQIRITVGEHGNTVLQPGQTDYGGIVRPRGSSPRLMTSINDSKR